MSDVIRFGVSLPRKLLTTFDAVIKRKGYKVRSEAVRDLIRAFLADEEASRDEGFVVGAVTLVYDHRVPDVQEHLTEIQHEEGEVIISTMHVHLRGHHCLEVLAVKGPARRVRKVADRLVAARGVKHGKLTVVAAGESLP